MKICLAQYDICWENKKENMDICEQLFESAAENRADLIVFPELSLTGFSMDMSLAESSDGDTSAFFSECAERYGAACVFGYAERIGDELHNRLAYADKQGQIQARYSKMHPFTYGGEIFAKGGSPVCFCIDDMYIGLTICYDLRFPELYQELSKSCGCIIVSASWPKSRREHWLTLLRARAIENQCYIIGCNRTGNGDGIEYCGDSVVFSPDGLLVADGADRCGIVLCEISGQTVSEIRKAFPLKQDRRPVMYKNFYE